MEFFAHALDLDLDVGPLVGELRRDAYRLRVAIAEDARTGAMPRLTCVYTYILTPPAAPRRTV
jgi:hypothetical protein